MSLATAFIPLLVGIFLLMMGVAVVWDMVQVRRLSYSDQPRHAEKVLKVFLVIAAADMTIFLLFIWVAGRH